jgi:hypothetical protein
MAVEAWHGLARLVGRDAVPDGSRRVPIEFPPPRTSPWHESEFRVRSPLAQARGGTQEGLNGD